MTHEQPAQRVLLFVLVLLASLASSPAASSPTARIASRASSLAWRSQTTESSSLEALAPAQATPEEIARLEADALALLNAARLEEGLPLLILDTPLTEIARRHSQELAERGVVSHHSNMYGLSTERRIRVTYPEVPRLGENIARNRTIARAHEGLMRSPGHRANCLDPSFTHVGIGVARSGRYALYLTQVFVQAGPAAMGQATERYFDAEPTSYERREEPRVVVETQTYRVAPPGPEGPEYWTLEGIHAFSNGDLEAAESHFRRALEIQPEYAFALYDLSRVLIRRQKSDEAAILLDGYLATYPNDVDAWQVRGSAALLSQNYETAETAYRTVLRERPREASAWYNLGLALEYQGRLPEAGAAYSQALHIDPVLHAARAGLARLQR
jgi:uncharacterized protein YkwD/Flp pilus assembly protein TadD